MLIANFQPPTPAMAAAIEDLLATVEEMHRETAKALTLRPGHPGRLACEEHATDLAVQVKMRADRDGLDLGELLERAADRINLDRRHGLIASQARIAA